MKKSLNSILFIEDEADTLNVYTDFFKRRVDTVITASTGKEGLRKFLLHKPTLIITDIKMPDMNGIQLIKAIRDADPNVPILVFSAFAGEDFLLQGVSDMVNATIEKPADTKLLSETIDHLLIKTSSLKVSPDKERDTKTSSTSKASLPLVVVGIGASAGGLEALTALVKGLPVKNQSAYIVAQHLSPTHKTMLVDLLNRETVLKVVDAEHGQKLQSDYIYITPPNSNIELSNKDTIILSSPEENTILPKPSVNKFFTSLAEHKKEAAIGIILSGTGSDGAQGMRAINAEGGITIVQDPETAKYDGMPIAAINVCPIDIIIDPSQIGEELVALANFPRQKVLQKFQLTQPNDEMSRIFSLLYRSTKVDFSIYKKSTIGRRIERRMVTTKATNLKDYVDILTNNEEEIEALFKDILIGVTTFFRDHPAFEKLKQAIKTYILNHPERKEIRVWISGCSTGEETYSTLIIMSEIFEEIGEKKDIRLFATDIDEGALKVARKGVYSQASMTGISAQRIQKNFDIQGSDFSIKKEIREMAVFSYHNLLSDPPFKDVDILICRNLLIYLTPDAQKYIMPAFHYSLHMDGILFLGKSENATNFEQLFANIDKKYKIFKQIPSARKNLSIKTNDTLKPKSYEHANLNVNETKKTIREVAIEAAAKVLLPNIIVTNEQLELLYKKGQFDYIKIPDGYVSYNLYKMIDPRVSIDLRSLVSKAFKDEEKNKFSSAFIPIPSETDELRLIRIHLVKSIEKQNVSYIFYFQEINANELPSHFSKIDVEGAKANDFIELELERTREHMQTLVEELETTNEELQATNEELQSSNEELQSTNEELETSNEELQSTNEELHTAYAELKELYSTNEKSRKEFQFLTQRYETLLDTINEGVIVSNLEGIILRTNSSVESILGLSADKLLSMGWNELLPDHVLKKKRSALIEKGSSGPYQLDYQINVNDIRHLRFNDYLLKSSEETSQVWSFIEDISNEVKISEELRLSEQKYKATFNTANIGIAHVGLEGQWLLVNKALCDLLEYTEDEIRNLTFQDITHPDDLEEDLGLVDEILSGKRDGYKLEKRYITKTGRHIWIMLSVAVVRNPQGSPQYFISVIEDISTHVEQIVRSNQAQVVFNSTQEGIMITDERSNIISINPALVNITGLSSQELIGKPANILKSGIHSDDYYQDMWRSISLSGYWRGEIINKKPNGDLYSVYLNVNAVKDNDGNTVQYIGVLTDITDLKESQEKVEFIANHDVLTGLPNRGLMLDHLTHAMSVAKRNSTQVGVLFIDLDRFKIINDGFGHKAGDYVLIESGSRIQSAVRESDTVCRLGGDEFIVILEDLSDPLYAGKVADQILSNLSKLFIYDTNELSVSASIGISIYPIHAMQADELVRQADIAMYDVKSGEKNGYKFASDDLSASALEKATMEHSISHAIEQHQLFLEYQPIVNLNDYRLSGLEALIRWAHPDFNTVMPNRFIPIAEESDLICKITKNVIYQAINCISDLSQKLDGFKANVSINLSAKDLMNGDLFSRIRQHLLHKTIEPDQLVIELTERKFAFGDKKQISALKRYNDFGIGISIDDFGTGYSNLSSLVDLPVKHLKIDRSFVSKIGLDKKAEEIIKATIHIAKALDISCIAEGIETEEQLDFLKKNECALGQGFYFSKPLNQAQLIQKLSQSEIFTLESDHAK